MEKGKRKEMEAYIIVSKVGIVSGDVKEGAWKGWIFGEERNCRGMKKGGVTDEKRRGKFFQETVMCIEMDKYDFEGNVGTVWEW